MSHVCIHFRRCWSPFRSAMVLERVRECDEVAALGELVLDAVKWTTVKVKRLQGSRG